jgi:hypothetical protein
MSNTWQCTASTTPASDDHKNAFNKLDQADKIKDRNKLDEKCNSRETCKSIFAVNCGHAFAAYRILEI